MWVDAAHYDFNNPLAATNIKNGINASMSLENKQTEKEGNDSLKSVSDAESVNSICDLIDLSDVIASTSMMTNSYSQEQQHILSSNSSNLYYPHSTLSSSSNFNNIISTSSLLFNNDAGPNMNLFSTSSSTCVTTNSNSIAGFSEVNLLDTTITSDSKNETLSRPKIVSSSSKLTTTIFDSSKKKTSVTQLKQLGWETFD